MNNLQKVILYTLSLVVLSLGSCKPLPTFEINDVKITSETRIISSGYVEQFFTTDRDAYYLIGIEPVREGYDPLSADNQKPYMTLKLDQANSDYLNWRSQLLRDGEFTIASFASHSLHYGETDYFFTGLTKGTDYWIYAFVVDPERMVPKGKLNLVRVTTAMSSTVDVHFEYRIKGYWDYVYPMDSTGKIVTHYPYVMESIDSTILATLASSPQEYFKSRLNFWIENPENAHLLYGIYARQSIEFSEEDMPSLEEYDFYGLIYGHVYYTFICGYDDGYFHPTLYKFCWKGANSNLYFKNTQEDNLFNYTDRW